MNNILKKIFMILLVVFTGLTVACKQEEVAIKITASKTSVQKGDEIQFSVEVSGTENKGYTWNITNMDLLTVDISLKGTVLKNVKENTEVTVTVTSTADTSKSDTVVITVEPLGSSQVVLPTISITPDKTSVVKDDVVNFTVNVANSEDTTYTLTSSNTDLVVIEGNTAIVVAVPTTLDQVVTITATLTSNPTVTSSTS